MDALRYLYQHLKKGWLLFAHALGWVNTRILLGFFYLVLVGLYALCAHIARPFRGKQVAATAWTPYPPQEKTVEALRHPF